jgi:TonB family protein
MKMLVAVATLTLAASSTSAFAGSTTRSTGPARAAAPEPEKSSDAAAIRFPARLRAPDLGRAQEVASSVVARRRVALGTLVTRVRLCVAPSGAVTDVKLVKASGAPAFDKAVLENANTWVYASYPAPASVRVCRPVSVLYRPR